MKVQLSLFVLTSLLLLVHGNPSTGRSELFDAQEFIDSLETDGLDLEQLESAYESASGSGMSWTKFHDLETIYGWLDEMVAQYPNLTNYNFGQTYENRTLRAVKLSNKPNNPTIFIESGIIAYHRSSIGITTYILRELLSSNKPRFVYLAQNFDWVIAPVLNPDGYFYVHDNNDLIARRWEKNRVPNECNGTYPSGVNIFRNFDVQHHLGEKSPCEDEYNGPSPNSELETQALIQFIRSLTNVEVYLSFQEGRGIIFPYAYTAEKPKNYDELKRLADVTAAGVEKRFGRSYLSAQFRVRAFGTSIDWMYEHTNIKFVYKLEFIGSRDKIIPSGMEALEGLVALTKELSESF